MARSARMSQADETPLAETLPGLPAALAQDEILLVWRPLLAADGELARLRETLTAEECAIAARYHFAHDRVRSIVSRGTLRSVLGRLLEARPEAVVLESSPHGKPVLRGGALEFNVSHAGTHLLIGFVRGRALGVDVEGGDRRLDVDELAPTVFTAGERAALARYEGEAKRDAFLRGWTRKEAYLKARGVGLSLPLTDFSVSMDEAGAALSSHVDPAEAARFVLMNLSAPPGYAAAICWARAPRAIRQIYLVTLTEVG